MPVLPLAVETLPKMVLTVELVLVLVVLLAIGSVVVEPLDPHPVNARRINPKKANANVFE